MLTKFYRYGELLKLNEMTINDKVDKAALNKIRKCFTQIITNWGFFAELLFQLKIVECDSREVPTMATDGVSIGYSADFVHKLTEAEVIFVIIHEIMHCANFHFDRQGVRDHELWNWAADYAINIMIDDMRKEMKSNQIEPPKGILLDDKYRGMSAEMIYKILEDEQQKQGKKPGQPGQGQGQGQPGQGQPGQGQPGQGQGQPGQGKGAMPGDIRRPGSIGGEQIYKPEKGEDIKTDIEKALEGDGGVEKLKKAWQDKRNEAASKNPGSGSDSLDRWLRKVNKPKINWRAELKKFVAQIFDELDYQYSNRRFIWQDQHLPGPQKADKATYSNVVIAIDTSGSIGDDTLAKFGAEMLKLFKTYNIQKCHVIWCDSQIASVQTFDVDKSFKLDKLKPAGGGGTSFKPPFKWILDNILKKGKIPAFVIYFTDAFGEAPLPSEYQIRNYAKRVLWVITENDDAKHLKFGKKIYIDKLPG